MTAIIITAIVCGTVIILLGLGAWGANRQTPPTDWPVPPWS